MECIYKISHEPLQLHHHDECGCHHHDVSNEKVLKASLIVTVVAMVIELVYGFVTNSLALLSDAMHMITHVIALSLSYFAIYAAQKFKNKQKTFGYHRMEIVAAFINAILIAIFTIFIVYEGISKLISPEPIDINTMLVVAVFGLVVNIITGLIMLKGDMENLNIKSSFIHMMSDLLSSIAIIIGGIVVYFTDFYFIDSILAIFIAVVISKWALSLFKQSLNILLEASPVDVDEIKDFIIKNHKKILDIHDIHIVQITKNMNILTAHITINLEDMKIFKQIIDDVSDSLRENFHISHITIQPEWHN